MQNAVVVYLWFGSNSCFTVSVAASCNNASAAIDNVSILASSAECGDALAFHERCGTLVKLSNNRCTAERQRPLDEFNNGVVMTVRPLRNDERFEVSVFVCHCASILQPLLNMLLEENIKKLFFYICHKSICVKIMCQCQYHTLDHTYLHDFVI